MVTEEQKNKPEVEEKDINMSEEAVETAADLSTEKVEESTEATGVSEEVSEDSGSADLPLKLHLVMLRTSRH